MTTRPLELTAVTDRGRLVGRDLPAFAAECAAAGIDSLQVREKDLSDRALRDVLRDIARAVAGTALRLVVNGRPDHAMLAGAAGVQLPAEGLGAADVRRAFPGLGVGVSCHSAEDARRAEAGGADWIVVGPVFATPGTEARALGLPALSAIVARTAVPVHAVGGIDPENVRAVAQTGVRGVLAIRAFTTASPADAAAAFRGAR